MPLTRSQIEAAQPDPERDVILKDEGRGSVQGFYVRIRKGGTKTYYLVYRNAENRQRRYKIAACSEMTVEAARAYARDELWPAIRRGEDPAGERAAKRKGETDPPPPPGESYVEAVEDYITREQKGRRQNVSADEIAGVLRRYGWGEKELTSIEARDIRKRLEEIRDGHNGLRPRPYMANRTYAYMRTFFDWCCEDGIDKLPDSPMRRLKRPWNRERARDRHFSDDELRALWRTADEIAADPTCLTGRSWGAFLKVLLLTGRRRGILAAMRRDEISESGLWSPPPGPSNKRRHITPLSKLALRIIRAVPQKEGNPHVFAGRNKGKHIDPGSQFSKAIKERSGISDFFCHAARHTVETRLAQLRVAPHIRDLLLDHVSKRGTGDDYDHYTYEEEMREAAELWADHLQEIVSEGEGVARLL